MEDIRYIKLRRATAAEWAEINPVLREGEPAWETDAKKLKVGDGVTPYSSLPYSATDLSAVATAIANAETATTNATNAASSATSAASSANTAAAGANASKSACDATNASVTAAESARVSAESGRVSAESARVSAESSRVSAESARVSAESTRASNEETRIENETARQSAESTRSSLFNSAQGQRAADFNTAQDQRATAFATEQSNRATAFATEQTNRGNTFTGSEASRATTFSTNEGSSTDAANANGSRWARFNASEASRAATFTSKESQRDAAVATATALTPRVQSLENNTYTKSEVDTSIGNKADKNGHYEGMSVAMAENLIGKGNATEHTFTDRVAGGGASIEDGVAEYRKVKGNSVVANQLVNTTTTSVSTEIVRKYLTIISGASAIIDGGSAVEVVGGTDKVVDLTKWYNGNVPSGLTADKFLELNPQVLTMGYNEGEIVNFTAKKVVTTGRNLCCPFEVSGNKLMSADYIEVLHGKTYYLGSANLYQVRCYDANKNDIGEASYNYLPNAFKVILKDGTCFVKIILDSTSASTNIPFNIYDESYNGTYEPYDTHELDVDPSTIKDADGNQLFPYGICKVGDVYDEITKDGAIKRVGCVDLGTLNFGLADTNLFSASVNGIKVGYRINTLLCSIYTLDYSDLSVLPNMCYQENTNGEIVFFKNTSYSDASLFKSAMSGVYLFYELATQVSVTFSDERQTDIEVFANGTEKIVAAEGGKSTPIVADVNYGIDYVGTIDRLHDDVGKASDLTTTAKNNLVSAINELVARISALETTTTNEGGAE